jgi:ABC-type polysaccharide/polyol phosphate export permease
MAPSRNFGFLFVAAGLLLVSILFLTSSPLDVTSLILGIIPLLFLLCFGFSLWRARKMPGTGQDKTGEGGN